MNLIERLQALLPSTYEADGDGFYDTPLTIAVREAADALASLSSPQEPIRWLYDFTDPTTGDIIERLSPEDPSKGWNAKRVSNVRPLVVASPVVPVAAKAEAEGWRPAPKEPTEAMIKSGMGAHSIAAGFGEPWEVQIGDVYRAMLAAAPTREGEGRP